MSTKLQKRLTASRKSGKGLRRLNPDEASEISMGSSRFNMRKLIKEGLLMKKELAKLGSKTNNLQTNVAEMMALLGELGNGLRCQLTERAAQRQEAADQMEEVKSILRQLTDASAPAHLDRATAELRSALEKALALESQALRETMELSFRSLEAKLRADHEAAATASSSTGNAAPEAAAPPESSIDNADPEAESNTGNTAPEAAVLAQSNAGSADPEEVQSPPGNSMDHSQPSRVLSPAEWLTQVDGELPVDAALPSPRRSEQSQSAQAAASSHQEVPMAKAAVGLTPPRSRGANVYVPRPLPDGWSTCLAEGSGKRYFYDCATGTAQWVAPDIAPGSSHYGRPLPDNWASVMTHDNVRYFFHTVTKQSQWEPPQMPGAAPPVDAGIPRQETAAARSTSRQTPEAAPTGRSSSSSTQPAQAARTGSSSSSSQGATLRMVSCYGGCGKVFAADAVPYMSNSKNSWCAGEGCWKTWGRKDAQGSW